MTERARLKVHAYAPGIPPIERIPACRAWRAADPRISSSKDIITCVYCLSTFDPSELTDKQREILRRHEE